jgi:hypothetical protein
MNDFPLSRAHTTLRRDRRTRALQRFAVISKADWLADNFGRSRTEADYGHYFDRKVIEYASLTGTSTGQARAALS